MTVLCAGLDTVTGTCCAVGSFLPPMGSFPLPCTPIRGPLMSSMQRAGFIFGERLQHHITPGYCMLHCGSALELRCKAFCRQSLLVCAVPCNR